MLRPYVWMLLGAVSFASMGALAHALSDIVSWPVIALGRVSVPLVLTAVAAAASGVRLPILRPRGLWVRSVAGSISLVCAFFALTHLPVSDAITLTNLYPIWIALLSWPLLGSIPGAGVWLAICAAVAGVGLIQRPHLADGNFASVVAVGSSLTAAVAMIGLHRLKGVDARAIVFHFSAVSFVACLLAWSVAGGSWRSDASLPTALMLVGAGLAATLGQLCITLAFAAGAPARVSVVGLTQVPCGMLFDVVLWGRTFDALSLAGIALVVLPTAWLLWTGRATRPAGAAGPGVSRGEDQGCGR